MARLFSAGFESQIVSTTAGNAGESDQGSPAILLGSTGTTTITTTNPRSGKAACSCGPGASNNPSLSGIPGVLDRTYYFRVAFRFNAIPSANSVILVIRGAAQCAFVRMLTSGRIRLEDSAQVAVGSNSAVLSVDTWYVLEVQIMVPTAGNGVLQAQLDGVNFAGSNSVSVLNAALVSMQAGHTGSGADGMTIVVDDIALNDDQGASQNIYPGLGKVFHLWPVSDNARSTGMVGGAGGTTSLFDAVNNAPPIGVAVGASSTDLTQVEDAANNATDNYDANVGAYSDSVASGGGGLSATDTIVLVQGVLRKGNSTTTSRNAGVEVVSNPAIANVSAATGTTAAGTETTGWRTHKTTVAYAPSVTLATKPVVRFGKRTASTDALTADQMGLLVEYLPTIPLGTSVAVSTATLALTAATQIPLGTSAAVSASTLALNAPAQVLLGASAAASTASVTLTVPGIAFITVASDGVSTASAALTAKTEVPLQSSAATSTASLSLTASTRIPLGTSAAASSASLALTAPARIALASAAQSTATLALTASPKLALASAAQSTATLALTAKTLVPLSAATATSSASLAMTARAIVVLEQVFGISTATLELTAPARISLVSAGQSNASLALEILASGTLLLAPVVATSGGTLVVVGLDTKWPASASDRWEGDTDATWPDDAGETWDGDTDDRWFVTT